MSTPAHTFTEGSAQYATERPLYPAPLYEWLASVAPARNAAWDCATGTGQAAVGLAAHFARVDATDESASQIQHAAAHDRVTYTVAPAESPPFSAGAFDLITTAQALHWFDFGRFWPQVERVAKPGAVFCAWGYAWMDTDAEVHELLLDPIREAVEPHWAPNNRLLWEGYQASDVAFPFDPISVPSFSIEVRCTPARILSFVQTWSAYKRAVREPAGADRLQEVLSTAAPLLVRPDPVEASFPIETLAGRVGGGGATPAA